jgi:hypothetical protein
MPLRPLFLGVATAVGLLSASAAQAQSQGVITGTANIRSCAAITCAAYTAIPAGTYVPVYGKQGSWYNVVFGVYNGFVHQSLLSLLGPSYYPTPIAPPPGYPPYPPQPWPYGQPVWNAQYNMWYAGGYWWYGNSWHNSPPSSSPGLQLRFNIPFQY